MYMEFVTMCIVTRFTRYDIYIELVTLNWSS